MPQIRNYDPLNHLLTRVKSRDASASKNCHISIFTTFAKQSMINRLSNAINRNRSAAKISKVMSSSIYGFDFSIDSGQLCPLHPGNTLICPWKFFWSPVQHPCLYVACIPSQSYFVAQQLNRILTTVNIILTPRIRDSYCYSSCVTEKTG